MYDDAKLRDAKGGSDSVFLLWARMTACFLLLPIYEARGDWNAHAVAWGEMTALQRQIVEACTVLVKGR